MLDAVFAADRLVRLHFLVFSGAWPLLGAASVRPELTPKQLVAVLGAMFCFHTYTMVLNDLVDLPIDRTDPRRQRDLIACGAITRWQALVIILVQPLVCVSLTMWLGSGGRALETLAVGFASMTIYDLWGKRCALPLFTDAIQGIGWASLAVYAACACGDAPNALTWMVAAYAVVFTLLFNGIHGPLRDLEHDFAGGARTMAIFLGARPRQAGAGPRITTAVQIYAWGATIGVVAINAAIVLTNHLGYSPIARVSTTAVVLAIDVVIVMLQFKVVQPLDPAWEAAYRLQLYAVTVALPAAFVARFDRATLLAFLLLNVVSLLMFGSTPLVMRWSWRTVRAIVTAGAATRLADRTTGDRLDHVKATH